jgi:hypothetical protein
MSSLTGPLFLRTSIGRLAVTGAATLVTVMGFAPAAVADDDLAPESSSLDPVETTSGSTQEEESAPELTVQEQTPPPADETTAPPAEEQPAPPTDDTVDDTGDDTGAGPTTPDETTPPVTDDATDEATLVEQAPEPGTEAAEAAAATLTLAPDTVTAVSGRTVRIDVLANDTSNDRIRSLTIETQGAHGTAYVVGTRGDGPGPGVPGKGSLAVELDADAGYVGPDSFTYRVTTEDGTTAVATVTVDVQAAQPVTGNFGSAKFRIGVQAADGAYLPAGTTTTGSVFRIDVRLQDGSTSTSTCTTGTEASGTSYCNGLVGVPGATYTITQQSAPAGLVPSSRTRVVDACEEEFLGFCGPGDVVFVDAGSVLPVARDDAAASTGGDAVDVDVLANDDSEDPQTTLSVDDQPLGGTAEVVGEADRPEPPTGRAGTFVVPSAGTQRVRYTPVDGFEGLDTFTYRLTNGNGSSTAQVTVEVSENGSVTPVDPDPTDSDDGDVAADDASDGPTSSGAAPAAAGLPSTGGPDVRLLALGGALVAGGAAAVAGSRRRRDVAGG